MYGFIFPSESPQPKPLIRFERTIRQKMRLGARMCPFSKFFSSFSCLRGAFVQNPHYFQAGIGKPSQTQKCYYFKNFWFNLYAERLERRSLRPESCFLIWLFQSFHVLVVIFQNLLLTVANISTDLNVSLLLASFARRRCVAQVIRVWRRLVS